MRVGDVVRDDGAVHVTVRDVPREFFDMLFAVFMLPTCGEGAAQHAPPSLRGSGYFPIVLSASRWLRFVFRPLASISHGLLLKRSWGPAQETRHAQGSRQGLARLARGSRQGLARLALECPHRGLWHTPGAGRGGLSWVAAAERAKMASNTKGHQKFKHEESQTQELQETTFSWCRNDNCRRARHGLASGRLSHFLKTWESRRQRLSSMNPHQHAQAVSCHTPKGLQPFPTSFSEPVATLLERRGNPVPRTSRPATAKAAARTLSLNFPKKCVTKLCDKVV
jgi:hypothetical protein